MVFLLSWLQTAGFSQDRLYSRFSGNESSFNPALAGFRGAFSLSGRMASQWQSAQLSGVRTGFFRIEESLPCSLFDYDLHAEFNREGSASYQTIRLGGNLAGTAPFTTGQTVHNLRIGMGLIWQASGVDFSNLIFSDQLHPKYGPFDVLGNRNPTSFAFPSVSRTAWFFAPSAGLSHRILFNPENKRSASLLWGVAIHHFLSLGNGKSWGQTESLLGLETPLPYRLHGFFQYTFIPYYRADQFVRVIPQVTMEQQGNVSYWNAGVEVSLNRNLALGAYFQRTLSEAADQNAQWLSLQVGLGSRSFKEQKIDIHFAYNIPLTGLRNQLGPFLEAGIAFHFSKSPACGLLGQENALAYPGVQCPSSSFSRPRRKLYENIW